MIKNESGQWHAIEYKEVLEKLGSSIQGLGLEEVKNRRQKYGKTTHT
jgi:hypothetical protein